MHAVQGAGRMARTGAPACANYICALSVECSVRESSLALFTQATRLVLLLLVVVVVVVGRGGGGG